MTRLFVAAGAVVLVVEMGTAGAALGAYRAGANHVTSRGFIGAILLAIGGVVLQNLI